MSGVVPLSVTGLGYPTILTTASPASHNHQEKAEAAEHQGDRLSPRSSFGPAAPEKDADQTARASDEQPDRSDDGKHPQGDHGDEEPVTHG